MVHGGPFGAQETLYAKTWARTVNVQGRRPLEDGSVSAPRPAARFPGWRTRGCIRCIAVCRCSAWRPSRRVRPPGGSWWHHSIRSSFGWWTDSSGRRDSGSSLRGSVLGWGLGLGSWGSYQGTQVCADALGLAGHGQGCNAPCGTSQTVAAGLRQRSLSHFLHHCPSSNRSQHSLLVSLDSGQSTVLPELAALWVPCSTPGCPVGKDCTVTHQGHTALTTRSPHGSGGKHSKAAGSAHQRRRGHRIPVPDGDVNRASLLPVDAPLQGKFPIAKAAARLLNGERTQTIEVIESFVLGLSAFDCARAPGRPQSASRAPPETPLPCPCRPGAFQAPMPP